MTPQGWFADIDKDADSGCPWAPYLQLDGLCLGRAAVRFATEQECTDFIRDELVGQGLCQANFVGEPLLDRKVIQCNYTEGTSVASEGARAYLVFPNRGNGYDRITILVRSRGARWVEKWEKSDRLRDFRVKTLPPEHPLYSNDRLFPADAAEDLLDAMRGRTTSQLPEGDQ